MTPSCDASYWTDAFSSAALICDLPGEREEMPRLCGIQNEKQMISLSANNDIVR